MNSNNVLQKVRMMVFGFLMLFILNPISVSANGVSDAIQKVVNVYPNSCSYFTSDGKSDSNSSDSRCSLVVPRQRYVQYQRGLPQSVQCRLGWQAAHSRG